MNRYLQPGTHSADGVVQALILEGSLNRHVRAPLEPQGSKSLAVRCLILQATNSYQSQAPSRFANPLVSDYLCARVHLGSVKGRRSLK